MRHLRKPDARYSTTPSSRRAIPDCVRKSRPMCPACGRFAAAPEQVIVVNGSQQALDLCARLLLEAGDDVAMENPGYRGAHRVFSRVRSAPASALHRRRRHRGSATLTRPRQTGVRHPSHQLPTGVSMSLTRRLEVIEWARRAARSSSKTTTQRVSL